MQGKICQIVVTYNRKELLVRNLKSVLKQSYPVDILIFDNNSNDGTYDYLKAQGFVESEKIHYYRSEKNIGGAGGFSKGLQIAYEMGYSFFWLMDDDGYCVNRYTLEKLLEYTPDDSQAVLINSTVICDEKKTLTFGFKDIYTYEELLLHSIGGKYEGYINPFNSTLISRACVDKIGVPKGEFFIYGDEHEYMLRALKSSVPIFTVLDSLYYHPVNRKIEYRKSWRYEIPIKDEPVWKTFCDVRNNIYITKHYDGMKMTLIKIYIYLTAARIKKHKRLVYFKYTILGIIDGLTNNFSRPIMFNK